MIGDIFAPELRRFTDPVTGRLITQFTSSAANNYPLYYFAASLTRDGRYLVFHSERSGFVQLYRLDLATGEIGQLSDGRTDDSGWAIWCEWHLRGIFSHLSALSPQTGEVYYFQDDEIRATQVETFANRRVAMMPEGRMSIGQTDFSPDGSLFAFIHVDRDLYVSRLKEREALTAMGQFNWARDHHDRFRNSIPTTLSVLDVASGTIRDVTTTDFHFHHVLFVDDTTLLLNHPKGCAGMWTVELETGKVEHLRPGSDSEAHGAEVNHQVITRCGIAYEAVTYGAEKHATYLGLYDPRTGAFSEGLLPLEGYVHTGFDPAGRFEFVEHAAADRHELLAVSHPADPAAPLDVQVIRTLRSPDHDQQRHHAHPFLSRDRTQMFFTDWDDAGFGQIFAVGVGDLTA